MRPEFEEPVFEFARQLSRLNSVQSVVLFGSVAKGEANNRSDIDVLVIMDTTGDVEGMEEKRKVSNIALNIERAYDVDLQLVFSNRNFHGLDPQFVEDVLREGFTLFGRGLFVEAGKIMLEPYCLIHYSLSNLSRSDKMRVGRALYGRRTEKRHEGKVYTSESTGLLEELGGRRTGIASIMVPSDKAKVLTDVLGTFSTNWEKLDLWLPKE